MGTGCTGPGTIRQCMADRKSDHSRGPGEDHVGRAGGREGGRRERKEGGDEEGRRDGGRE